MLLWFYRYSLFLAKLIAVALKGILMLVKLSYLFMDLQSYYFDRLDRASILGIYLKELFICYEE